jgi:prepilin-type N-terminal cleavage/methylation domain-containing protein
MRNRTHSRSKQSGFSLLEMLIVVAVLTAVLGIVFRYISSAQKVYRTQETKVDATETAREAIDEITRELHQAGYPRAQMYAPGTVTAPSANSFKVAVGLVKVTPTELWFEGDIDGAGNVSSIHYVLYGSDGNPATNASTCPCTLQRSASIKVDGTAPMGQPSAYNSAIEGVINSRGAGAAGAALQIIGNTAVGGSTGTITANDVLFASYKNAPVFAAFDANGVAVALPTDIVGSPATISSIRTINISVNILARNQDAFTNVQPVVPMTASVRLNNF